MNTNLKPKHERRKFPESARNDRSYLINNKKIKSNKVSPNTNINKVAEKIENSTKNDPNLFIPDYKAHKLIQKLYKKNMQSL